MCTELKTCKSMALARQEKGRREANTCTGCDIGPQRGSSRALAAPAGWLLPDTGRARSREGGDCRGSSLVAAHVLRHGIQAAPQSLLVGCLLFSLGVYALLQH